MSFFGGYNVSYEIMTRRSVTFETSIMQMYKTLFRQRGGDTLLYNNFHCPYFSSCRTHLKGHRSTTKTNNGATVAVVIPRRSRAGSAADLPVEGLGQADSEDLCGKFHFHL